MEFCNDLSSKNDISGNQKKVDFLPSRKIKDPRSFLEDLKIGKAEA